MALIICPECKKQVSDTITACPHCGFRLPVTSKNKNSELRDVLLQLAREEKEEKEFGDFMDTNKETAKIKKPFYKKWWVWLLVIIFVSIVAANFGNSTVDNVTYTSAVTQQNQKTPAYTEKNTSITMGQKNALKKAKQYLSIMGFSKSKLIKQLEFDGYSTADATYAAENCNADWNKQAAKSAKNYIDTMSFSKSGLIQQLKFDGYSASEAEYGAKSVGY